MPYVRKEWDKEAADKAAKLAEAELRDFSDDADVELIIKWWNNWFMKSGHKRLGRLLVKRYKKNLNCTCTFR